MLFRMMNSSFRHHRCFCASLVLMSLCSFLSLMTASASEAPPQRKPVLLYTRYFNAAGEQRYLPDGTFSDVLQRLRGEFEMRVNSEPLTARSLRGVSLVLVANPSDKAVGTNPPPHHFSKGDIQLLDRFVRGGGGLIVMGNQENHNLEIEDTNKLLARFGIQFTNLYTDAKKLTLPGTVPVIGGLRWAYYTGNLLVLDPRHRAKPRGVVVNDLKQPPVKGTRDQAGVLLATAESGKGRVMVATDSGWVANDALSEKGVGDVAIHGQDNWEIFRRLALWSAHAEER